MVADPPVGAFSVTFIVVARNSVANLAQLISDIAAQDFPRERLEVVFVDSLSTDGTREAAERLLTATGITYSILSNPGKILATGWNLGLATARHDIIIRVDAHSRISPDFISRNVRAHENGEQITGGPVLSVSNDHPGSLLLAVERSRFGAGAADFRNARGTTFYADTVGFGAYRREIYARVGGYHEHLGRHQDNEIHLRMRRAGYRFYFDPSITSTRFVRRGTTAFFRQKFQTGYWITLTAAIQPGCFAPRHFVPLCFCSAVLASAVFALAFGVWWPTYVTLGPYFLFAVAFAIQARMAERSIGLARLPALPLLFFMTHFSYGAGTLCGIPKAPIFRAKLRQYSPPFPISGTAQAPHAGREEAQDADAEQS